jgi:hypothetical protein
MSRTKKILAGIIVGLIIVVGGLYMAIDTIVASVLRSEGTSVLGVQTQVESVKLGLFRPSTEIRGLTIANPEGFSRPNFVHVDRAEISATVGTMLSSDIQIPLVVIDGLTLDIEQINEKLNIDVIVENVKRHAHASQSPDTGADDNDDVKLNIARLEIRNITLTASGSIVNLAGGSLDTTIPSFTMDNVGTNTDDGELSGQIISLALSILLQHIADNPVKGLGNAAVGTMATALDSIPGLRSIGVSSALLKVNAKLNRGLEKATGGVKNVGKALGGLLDGLGGGSTDDDGAKDEDAQSPK